MNKEDIATFVGSERKARKRTVALFSEDTGITRSTIHSFESGARVPRLDTFLIMINALGYRMEIVKNDSKLL